MSLRPRTAEQGKSNIGNRDLPSAKDYTGGNSRFFKFEHLNSDMQELGEELSTSIG
tara:strand:+ start:799 stop:966 length:168 start_codon:yes stop_codon:yes gene_type:complete